MINKNVPFMKKFFALAVLIVLFLSSCSRGMTPAQAASGRQRCGHGYIK